MKLIDYEDWEQRHFDAFPQTAEWMAGRRDVAATRSAWQRALIDVELTDCRQATEAFLRGEEEPPKTPQDWPRFIRRVALRLAGQRRRDRDRHRHSFDGEETFGCLMCQDTGLVTVWHPKSMQAARDGKLAPEGNVPRYSAVVRCGCPEGDKRHLLCPVKYDPSKTPLWHPNHADDNLAELERVLSANAF